MSASPRQQSVWSRWARRVLGPRPLSRVIVLTGLLVAGSPFVAAAFGPERTEERPVASQRGFAVRPGEVWRGRRDPYWVSASLRGPARLARRSDPEQLALAWHETRQELGYNLSVFAPSRGPSRALRERWLDLKESQEVRTPPGLWVARTLGEVLRAPRASCSSGSRETDAVTGLDSSQRRACGLLLLGANQPVPRRSEPSVAARTARLYGGRAVLLGGARWRDESLREGALLESLDAVELYGTAGGSSVTDEADERLYRSLVSYSGSGLRLAAVAAAPEVPGRRGLRSRTLARVPSNDVDGLKVALDARATVAVRGISSLGLQLPVLGRVLRTGDVDLALRLARRVERVELWREQERVRVWTDVKELRHVERISSNAAYTFTLLDDRGRATTSPVWYEPRPRRRPELSVDPRSLAWSDGFASAVVRNLGDAPARFVRVGFYDRLPGAKRPRPFAQEELHRIRPGDALEIRVLCDHAPALLYVQLDSALGESGPGLGEESTRDDAALLVRRGARALRQARGRALDRRRSELRAHGHGAPRSFWRSWARVSRHGPGRL